MKEIAEELKKIIGEVFDIEIEPEVTMAPEGMKGSGGRMIDYASNVAMRLAGVLRKAPREIAEKIAEKIKKDDGFLFDIEVANPGFLNFISSDEYFCEIIKDFERNFEKNISLDEYSGKKVVTEFSDPNPFKVLHVGHLYTSIMGEAISKLIEHAGGEVVRVNFGGDVGLHVAKTLYVLTTQEYEDLRIEDIARAYVEGTKLYEENEEAKAEIVRLNKEIYRIVREDDHDGKLAEMYWNGRELSYKYFDDFYARIGVKFDKYYPESTVAGKGLEKVKEGLANGVYEESDGAVVFRGEKYGLHTRVFINKEGLPTYEAKDVGLIYTKWDDWSFDESIVITGNDIIDYMKVVLKSISLMSQNLVDRTKHITHGNVRLKGNEKMSSRKGNFLKAVDTLEAVKRALKEKYGTEDERIALAAVKYAFLKYKIGGNIIFDIDESVNMNGNSGTYLLYSTVRGKKILEKCGYKNVEMDNDKWQMNEWEKKLSKKIVQYAEILKMAVKEKAPHVVCNYLYELAQEFSRFYEHVKVQGSDEEKNRAGLVSSYTRIMEHGLNLMGMEVPEEM